MGGVSVRALSAVDCSVGIGRKSRETRREKTGSAMKVRDSGMPYEETWVGFFDPAMEIRLEQCIEWRREAGFHFNELNRYNLPPYHYGLLFKKPFTR